MTRKQKKLKKVHYFAIDGKLKAVEIYEDNSVRLVDIQDGMVNYILNGSEVQS